MIELFRTIGIGIAVVVVIACVILWLLTEQDEETQEITWRPWVEALIARWRRR